MINFDKLPSIIASLAIVIYIIGYIATVSYLSSLNISENVFLDFRLIKTGFLGFVLGSPVVFLFYSRFPNWKITDVDWIDRVLQVQLLMLGYAIALYFVIIKEVNFTIYTIVTLYIIFVSVVTSLINIYWNKKTQLFKMVFVFIPPIVTFIGIIFFKKSFVDISFFFFYQILFMACFSIALFNGSTNVPIGGTYAQIVTSLLIAISNFGLSVLPTVQQKFGGEGSKYRKVYFKPDFVLLVKDSKLGSGFMGKNYQNLDIIYETDTKYYIKNDSLGITSFNKDQVVSEETISTLQEPNIFH